MDQRVTLLKNFYLLTEIIGDIITVKLKFPPPLASLSQKQPLCDNTNLSVFAKYTTKNGKLFEPHRFWYSCTFFCQQCIWCFAIRYPLKIRRQSNVYMNPDLLMEPHLTHLTALSAENFWLFVEKLSGEGLQVINYFIKNNSLQPIHTKKTLTHSHRMANSIQSQPNASWCL